MALTALFAITLLSRFPFLGPGYGLDPDAWRLASTARLISETGQYHESRSPGHPVQELTCSLLWRAGPIALNGVTALLSAIAVCFFAETLFALGSRVVFAPALALAFCPVVYVNSVNAMDYVWALAFLLGALCFAIRGRPVVAGLFLGLATGTRITSAAAILPLGLLLGYRRRNLLLFVGSTVVTAILLYLPSYLREGR